MAARLPDPELIAKIGNLKVRARQVVDGVLTGLHKSPQHGSSIEFAEHKEYSPGDDIRHMDWKAFARFDRYYIKKFEDETNLRGFLLLDGSKSMGYGEGDRNKLGYARLLSATLAYLLLRQQDSAGLVTFRERTETYIPPRATSTHLQELLESLVRLEPDGKTDIVASLEQTAEFLRGRNVVMIFSDFFDHRAETLKLLARLRARKQEIILFHILHRDEIDLPFDMLTEFVDMENEQELVLADPDAIRTEYRRVFGEFMETMRSGSLQHGIHYQLAITDQPPESVLLSYLNRQEA
jgi:uncharacterized protein (DUF58 family)